MTPEPEGVRARHIAVACFLAAAGCAASGSPDPPPARLASGDPRSVQRTVDGDTLVLEGGERVRLIGIDTPETKAEDRPVECFGPEAAAHLSELLPPGTAVRLTYDEERSDRFGRTLAYVYRGEDGLFVNADLVAGGYARAGTYRPNVAHDRELGDLERRARRAPAGLWGACPA